MGIQDQLVHLEDEIRQIKERFYEMGGDMRASVQRDGLLLLKQKPILVFTWLYV